MRLGRPHPVRERAPETYTRTTTTTFRFSLRARLTRRSAAAENDRHRIRIQSATHSRCLLISTAIISSAMPPPRFDRRHYRIRRITLYTTCRPTYLYIRSAALNRIRYYSSSSDDPFPSPRPSYLSLLLTKRTARI